MGEGFWRTCKLRRFTMRLDGFVSIQAPLTGGELVTKPFRMKGSKLQLNSATSASGRIQVELQTASGTPIANYSLNDCREIYGDQTERVVHSKTSDVGKFTGQPLRLRFQLQDADLFSFRFV